MSMRRPPFEAKSSRGRLPTSAVCQRKLRSVKQLGIVGNPRSAPPATTSGDLVSVSLCLTRDGFAQKDSLIAANTPARGVAGMITVIDKLDAARATEGIVNYDGAVTAW
jgi:hypothetical protein